MRTSVAAAFVLAALSSCSGAQPPSREPIKTPATAASTLPAATTAAEASKPPGLRLSKDVVPTKASVTLTLVPTEDITQGAIDIDVTVNEPTRIVWLHAAEITVESASITQGGAELRPKTTQTEKGLLGLTLERALDKGAARVHIAFKGKVDPASDRGVFRQKEGEETYLFTQFENTEARRAFPCFDEPSFKIPWQLTLRVKPTDKALSNTPVVSETTEGGYTIVTFAETKPLPSYLVAFAVGPFDIVDAGKAGRKNTPLRLATPKGRGPEAAFAARSTAKLFSILEEYFDIAYPYDKMDIVTIPRLATFGAMENAGLITIASRLTLDPAAKSSPIFERRYISIMAHELAHQWFGDLVTMAWWDDVWLNEAFASWMGDATSERARPELGFDLERVHGAHWAMTEDSLITARKIRQEIESDDDIQNAFDGITYVKGQTVIEMFEGWVGAEPFRRGIHRYLTTRAMGNATSADFLADVSEGSGRDLRAAFATFLDRPGVPLVRASLSCEKGKPNASLSLAQERYLPIGSKGDASAAPWQIPVCARYGDGKSSARACGLLSERTGSIALPGAACPEWFALKEGGAGYYRAAYAKPELVRLLDKDRSPLTIAERVSVLHDMGALLQNGKLAAGDAFALAPALAKDTNTQVFRSAFWLVGSVPEAHVPPDLRPKFAEFIRSTFGAKAKALGFRSKPGDSVDDRRLRAELVPFVASRGDKALLEEAKKLAWRWLDDPTSLDDDDASIVLRAAASHGDRALFDRMRAELRKSKGGRTTDHLINGLSAFLDPALARESLSIVLTDEAPILDTAELLFQDRKNSGVALEFLKANVDAVVAKLPTEMRGAVVEMLQGICDEKGRAEMEALLKNRAASLLGGPRRLSQTLESISLCIAQGEMMRPSLEAFFRKGK